MINWEHQQTINTEQLKEAIAADNIKLVEVLSKKLFDEEHIKGAINIPLTEIKEMALKLLDKEDKIVIYCTDEDCLASPVATRTLREMGYKKVLDYEEGKVAWKAAGLPMEVGSEG